jgi:hypothetical protein
MGRLADAADALFGSELKAATTPDLTPQFGLPAPEGDQGQSYHHNDKDRHRHEAVHGAEYA